MSILLGGSVAKKAIFVTLISLLRLVLDIYARTPLIKKAHAEVCLCLIIKKVNVFSIYIPLEILKKYLTEYNIILCQSRIISY